LEAALQSLHVAIALAACSNATYRSSSTLGVIDAAVTMSLFIPEWILPAFALCAVDIGRHKEGRS
jgi:hypothetical protein